MIQAPADLAFIGIACVIMAITALRPQWTIYVLTCGHPERAQGRERSVAFMRLCATVALIGFAIALAYRLLISLGVALSVGL